MNSFFQTFIETVVENRVKLISIFIIGLVIKKLFEPILEKIILFLWFILEDWFDSSVNLFDDKSYWKYTPDDDDFLEELKNDGCVLNNNKNKNIDVSKKFRFIIFINFRFQDF